MLRLSQFTKTLLWATIFLLLSGCNEKSKTDDKAVSTTSTQSSQATPPQVTSTQVTSTSVDTTEVKDLILTIDKTTLNKDENTTVKVMVTYEDGRSKEITEKVEWIVTPKDSVTVSEKLLIAKKDNQSTLQVKLGSTLSNYVNLDITWAVNGHTLPPEPDKAVNDSTLLGIDVNDNGVRDDVERWIIIEEAKNDEFAKTKTAIALQYAWAWQKMIESPTLETRQYLEKASACQWYFYKKKLKNIRGYQKRRQWRKEHAGKLGVKLEDKLFNTKERILQRFEFNSACSGNIFESRKADLNACRINIDELKE